MQFVVASTVFQFHLIVAAKTNPIPKWDGSHLSQLVRSQLLHEVCGLV